VRPRHLALAGVALLFLPACGSGGSGGAPEQLARATRDRPDDHRGRQIHFVYAVPGGRKQLDRRRDVDGTLTNSIDLIKVWFRSQKRSPRLHVDTYRGRPDITFVRLPRENFEYDRAGPDALMRDVTRAAQLRDPDKLYAVYYDGAPVESEPDICGLATSGHHPFALVFLAQSCDFDFAAAGLGDYNQLVFVMAHELVHELGFVPACAPHSIGGGHVGDKHDLMYPDIVGGVPVLDVHNDDYYLAHGGCPDLSRSRYMTLH
jgi:hypothetical protein